MLKVGRTLSMGEDCAGAASGTRTHDLFVTNEMLYQLSYCGNESALPPYSGAKLQTFSLMAKFFRYLFITLLSFMPEFSVLYR